MRFPLIPALALAPLCATIALAGSPSPQPQAQGPGPLQDVLSGASSPSGPADATIEAPPPSELGPNCKRMVSLPLKRQHDQRTRWNLKGTCNMNIKGEQERQITQAKLECLMGGWEDAIEFKISCKRFMAFASNRKIPALHYEYSWRCARAECK